MDSKKIIALRMERQHLNRKIDKAEYDALYNDTQPGQNVYWSGFGNPPTITYRANFDDMEYNRQRQQDRLLLKGRFQGGNLGWIVREDLELFAGLSRKPLKEPTDIQLEIYELIKREGPMNIKVMKQMTGLLVKEITPVLHRLQEAFLIYEDQNDGEWDRGWFDFSEMFPEVNIEKYSRHEALKIILRRFAYRNVIFDAKMAKSFYKLPEKDINNANADLVANGTLKEYNGKYILSEDENLLNTYDAEPLKSVYAMHRNDFLVKSNEHWLKERFSHTYPDTMFYLLIDGKFKGVAVGKFRYTIEIEDIQVELPTEEAISRKEDILNAIRLMCGANTSILRYCGVMQS